MDYQIIENEIRRVAGNLYDGLRASGISEVASSFETEHFVRRSVAEFINR